jgi:uncharacterized protein
VAAWEASGIGEDERMTQPAKSQEPSMEEILASIRRIIADDDANKTAPRPAPPPEPPKAVAPPPPPRPAPPMQRAPEPPPPPPEPIVEEPPPMAFEPEPEPVGEADDQSSDILDLTESMAAPAPEPESPPQFRTIDGSFDIGYDDDKPEPPRPAPAPEPYQAFDPGERREERGPLLSSMTTAAVDSAFNTLAQTVLVQNARTLEDLVREMLRPMLKAWLDDNLPGMVERLVRTEIERVSRGRMG